MPYIEATNFQIEFEFLVGGKSDGLNGDGFAVWLTSERAENGPVFGNRDRFEGVGIFFDTYANARQPHSFPYVMAMVGDGKTSYDNNNDGLSNRVGGCEANFRGVTTPTKARITYSASSHALNLKLHTKAWGQWDDCFTIMDVKLPSHTYLGFTSHTGEVHDRHDIISVTTSMMSKGENFIGQRRNNAPPPPKKSGFGWYLKFLAVSAIFIAVIAVAFQMSKKNNMRRF
ncbi:hypothetical protein BG011_008791 [Mortierella polycephala]|uniref:L-type lectin-like domain-containing protein n=1 Tax=Mortierella polycephala TaxID=41804 RepID=A0A9P6PP87_9FUNG|nr:hypothetical protein BG011_008791 [Mortierella polycephala]